MGEGGRSASSFSSMHKTALVTIVVLASLAGSAVGQAPAPEPAWRESALAMVPSGYVAGQAYRTDEAGQTGYLAVYPANANDPKSPASVFAPRQALVVRLTKGDGGLRALSSELKPRAADGDDEDLTKLNAELAQKRSPLPNGTEPCDLGALPPPYRLKMGGSEKDAGRRLADRIPHHRLQGRLVPDRRRDAARQGI
jgi:hypothetical protein